VLAIAERFAAASLWLQDAPASVKRRRRIKDAGGEIAVGHRAMRATARRWTSSSEDRGQIDRLRQ
jgi:hypothetical protein